MTVRRPLGVDLTDLDPRTELHDMTIRRLWHGWTTPENAAAYERVLRTEVIPGIEAKQIPGYRGIEVLRRVGADEVEFVTVMEFDSLQSVIDFQGDDYARAYVPDVARAVLKRWDSAAAHFEVRTSSAEDDS